MGIEHQLLCKKDPIRDMNKANLRDLIAATGLEILPKLDSSCRFSACEALKFDGWPRKTIGHLLFYSIIKLCASFHINLVNSDWSYSPKTLNSGQNRRFFVPCDLEIWWMTLKSNRAPLPYNAKLCASFQSHRWIQTWVTVRKHSIRVKIGDCFVPCDLQIWQMTLKKQ